MEVELPYHKIMKENPVSSKHAHTVVSVVLPPRFCGTSANPLLALTGGSSNAALRMRQRVVHESRKLSFCEGPPNALPLPLHHVPEGYNRGKGV